MFFEKQVSLLFGYCSPLLILLHCASCPFHPIAIGSGLENLSYYKKVNIPKPFLENREGSYPLKFLSKLR